MTFEEHNKELKRRVLFCVVVISILFCVAYYFNKPILNYILQLGSEVGYEYIALTPQEVFVQTIRISGIFSLIASAPFIITQIIMFISPIFENKRTVVILYVFEFIALVMVALGMFFALKILLPFTVKYLYSFSLDYTVTNEISFEKFLSFIIMLTIALGITFLLPVFSAILGKVGLLNDQVMKKAFPVVVVLILIISALITPPDVMSQCIVAMPITALYGISILIVKLIRGEGK